MKKLLMVAVVLAPLFISPVSAQAACTSNKSSGSVKVGSSISNGSVTVCAATTNNTASSNSKTTAKTTTVKKTVTPVKVAPPPCVIKVPNAAAAYGLYVTGCSVVIVPPVIIVAKKTTTVTAVVANDQTDQAAFTPNAVGISSSPSIGSVGQPFFFSALASAHSKSATVLGKSAQVSFTPVSFDWISENGSGSGSSFSSGWNSEGSHSVSLAVNYAVSYSIGNGWIDAGEIQSRASTSVQVISLAAPQKVIFAPPLLVSGNCIANPSTYRC